MTNAIHFEINGAAACGRDQWRRKRVAGAIAVGSLRMTTIPEMVCCARCQRHSAVVAALTAKAEARAAKTAWTRSAPGTKLRVGSQIATMVRGEAGRSALIEWSNGDRMVIFPERHEVAVLS
jgi:hypothetical protein